MDEFKKPQLMMWTIIGLVILNLMAMGTLWRNQRPVHPGTSLHPPQGRGLHILEERLNLNEEQAQQLKDYRRQHFLKMQMLEHETHEARRTLNEQILHPDGSSIEELARTIGEKQTQLELARFDHFQKIADICNEEQKKHLLDLLGQLAEAGPRPSPQNDMGPRPGAPRMGEQGPPPPGGMPPIGE